MGYLDSAHMIAGCGIVRETKACLPAIIGFVTIPREFMQTSNCCDYSKFISEFESLWGPEGWLSSEEQQSPANLLNKQY